MIITGGQYKGRKIIAPDEKITRPTLSKVRMGVFNTLFSIIGDFEGKSFLDVFGGSGIMGLEALSRGFKEVLVFEKNPKAAQIIKKNYEMLGIKANIRVGDSLKFLGKLDKSYDVIYIDPPYMSEIYERVFELCMLVDTPPQPSPLGEGAARIIIAEHSEDININNFELLKEKNYGGKRVSFLKP